MLDLSLSIRYGTERKRWHREGGRGDTNMYLLRQLVIRLSAWQSWLSNRTMGKQQLPIYVFNFLQENHDTLCHNKVTYLKNTIKQYPTAWHFIQREKKSLKTETHRIFLWVGKCLSSIISRTFLSWASFLLQQSWNRLFLTVQRKCFAFAFADICWDKGLQRREWIFKQVLPKSRHSPRQRQDMCKVPAVQQQLKRFTTAVWDVELERMMMQDHRQDQLQFFYVSKIPCLGQTEAAWKCVCEMNNKNSAQLVHKFSFEQ